MTHVPNYSSLTAKYDTLIKEKKGQLTYDMLSNSCNVFLCGGCGSKPPEPIQKPPEEKCENKKSKGCCGGGGHSKHNESNPPVQRPPEEHKKDEKLKGCCGGGGHSKHNEQSGQPMTSTCSCSSDCGCKGGSKPKTEEKGPDGCTDAGRNKAFSKCLCSETRSFKHRHSDICGHPMIYHDGHIDYIVGNQLHHVHGDHCDDHGVVYIIKEKPSSAKKESNILLSELVVEEL